MTNQIFFFIFIPLLAIILLTINLMLATHSPYEEKNSPFECGFHSFLGQNRSEFSLSFYIYGLLFLAFDLELLIVYPYGLSAYGNDGFGLATVMIFFLVLTLGFSFEIGKGALSIDSRQTNLQLNEQPNEQPNEQLSVQPNEHFYFDQDTSKVTDRVKSKKLNSTYKYEIKRHFSVSVIRLSDEDDNYGEGSSSNPNLGIPPVRDKGKRKMVDEPALSSEQDETPIKKVRFDSPDPHPTMDKIIKTEIDLREGNIINRHISLEVKMSEVMDRSGISSETVEQIRATGEEYGKARQVAFNENKHEQEMIKDHYEKLESDAYNDKLYKQEKAKFHHESNMAKSRANQIEEEITVALSDPNISEEAKNKLESLQEENEKIREARKEIDELREPRLRSMWEKGSMTEEHQGMKEADTSMAPDLGESMPSYTDPED